MGIVIAFLIIFFVFALIYVFLIMPRVSDKADMELLTCDYAHRGLWNEACPENSLSAFARAVEHGYGIELDIQLSKDKKIMVFHDYDLKRMCGINKKVSEMTCEELRATKLLGSNQGIPTLFEVLKLIGGRVPLLIELKGEDSNTELCHRAADMLDKYRGPFCIESFNPLLLSWFKKYRPSYARGQLVTRNTSSKKNLNPVLKFALEHMILNFLSRPDFIAVHGKYRNTFNILLCNKVLDTKVFVWTTKNMKDYELCQREGKKSIFEKILP